MTTFTAKKIEDYRNIKKVSTHVSQLAHPANHIKDEFTKLFSYFDINDLKSLMLSNEKKTWIASKWIELNNINTNHLSVEKLLDLGLLQIPEYETLLKSIEMFNSLFQANGLDCFVKDLSEIYSVDDNEFVNPLVKIDDSPVFDRIDKFYTTYTINETENKYIETLELLAKTYMSLVNDWKVVPRNYIRLDFFSVITMEGGYVVIEPHHQVLRDYRKRNVKADVFEVPVQTEPTPEIELQEAND